MGDRSSRVVEACKRGARGASKGFVFFVTNEKTIQAGMTSAAFGVISKTTEGVAYILNTGVVPWAPQQNITASLLVVVFAGFFWADRNIEAWRDIVRETTGEDEAVDEAEEEG